MSIQLSKVELKEVEKLLQLLGFRVKAYAVTADELREKCLRFEKARWSKAPAAAYVMSTAGASAYIVLQLNVGDKTVCVPEANYIVDARGVYYVHEIDCTGRTFACAELARQMYELLSLTPPAELLLAIHPDREDLAAKGLLPQPQRSKAKEEEEERKEEQPKALIWLAEELRREPPPPPLPPQFARWPRDEAELVLKIAQASEGLRDFLTRLKAERLC